MSFTKNDLELIKSKIQLSVEIEKRSKIIKKGNDYWCCCPFHEEKTPSCKINDILGSYYCFGCGAKGDIFTIYTDLYNFSFPDAVRELAKKAGIKLSEENIKQKKENEIIFKILEISKIWFKDNLSNNKQCMEYLLKRSLSKKTINTFNIGYSDNPNTTLLNYLKNQKFKEEDILKSNVVKIDKNNKIRDFFYKRLIFPIYNEQNFVVGFGGRVLDNSNPKYINSPESPFFKKRSILYNLNNAKNFIRSKKNMLICEGYMDVISLYENNIKTAVAPLGTALTETQLMLSWKYVNKPTIMFDGDNSGLKASFKSALMALPFLTPTKYLQFIKLPKDLDPDSYINKFSIKEFVKILKNPIPIVNFIFDHSSASMNFKSIDNKVAFDKYIDDIVDTIKNNKIKYFYKNEFKNLFFEKIKSRKKQNKTNFKTLNLNSLLDKQINSFLSAYLNHNSIRDQLKLLFFSSNLLNKKQMNLIESIEKSKYKDLKIINIDHLRLPPEILEVYDKARESSVFQLFPYSQEDYDPMKALLEVEESIKNLNTRLSNLKKINKSLNEFEDKTSELTWDELKKISTDLHSNDED